jgi:hypothetical protein
LVSTKFQLQISEDASTLFDITTDVLDRFELSFYLNDAKTSVMMG